jgi:hypothetical protein
LWGSSALSAAVALSSDIDAMIVGIVADFKVVGGEREDFLAEARAAAFIAIQKYRRDKKAKLKTFIRTCVKNRLKDLKKSKQNDQIPTELNEIESLLPMDNCMLEVEILIYVQQLLTPAEYDLYCLSVMGYTKPEIIKIYSKENRCERTTRREVDGCFTRITQKLKSSATNQAEKSTWRTLKEGSFQSGVNLPSA